MADKSTIEWTDATWNPVTGCTVISPGCSNCYAMRLAGWRLRAHPSRAGLTKPGPGGPVWTGEVRLNEEWLDQPLRWRRPRRVFVCAHGDLFHEAVPAIWIDRVFNVMQRARKQNTFQILTKRPERARLYLEGLYGAAGSNSESWFARGFGWPILGAETIPFGNVWVGASVEDRARKDRIDLLRETPAALRFLSLEPLLEDLGELDLAGIGWVIVGGESGPGARPMHPDWVRSIRDQCQAAGVPFFFKQWGEWAPETITNPHGWPSSIRHEWADAASIRVGKKRAGHRLDGRSWDEMPAAAEPAP